jgi:DNA helicase-2/ATP-dependent DNA helicase PcrA
VYGREDARTLLREAATGLGIEVAPERREREPDPWALPLAKLAFALDRYRLGWSPRAGSSWDQEELDEDLLRHLRQAYEGLLHERGAVDYPSMLALPLRAFETEPRALSFVQDAYRFVMVDEFQDTCDSQFHLLRQIVERHRNLSVVGDPRQAIFAWRGADPKILLDFPREYPDAQVFSLDENHRSTGVVVALSNVLAAPLEAGRESWTSNAPGPRARVYTARDELDEARFVATETRRLLQAGEIQDAGEVAVLFRTNAQARTIALSLRAAGLPARVRADLAAC